MTRPSQIAKRTHDAQKLSLLLELSRAFSALVDLDELLGLVNAKTRDVLGAENCAILLLDPATDELFFPISSDLSAAVEARFKQIRFPSDRGIAGWVLKHGKGTIVTDASRDERFYAEVDRASGAKTHDLLYAPLSTRNGPLGVVGLRNKRSGVFSKDDLAFLEALAGSIAVAIENARLYAELKTSEQKLRTQVGALRRDLARRDRFTDIVGTGPAMAEVFRLMESAAASPIPVLITGETGTGKELVARSIHRASERAEQALLAINCAALSPALLESELFGHRRGSFTGADQDKRGLFEATHGGTIFLDEVGEMPAPMQAKLLRVLQEGEVTPVGDVRPRKVDVRVISATNRDPLAEVAAGRLRDDLYHRLAAFPIHVPPLRERREDIPLLAQRALTTACERSRKRVAGIDPAVLDLLARFDWPGNVRELENEMSRAVALVRAGDVIRVAELSAKVCGAGQGENVARAAPVESASPPAVGSAMRQGRAAFEARYIAEVLNQHRGNVSRAARTLGVSRVTLHKKLKEYGLR
jgi:transcriptional regulator with GAF, ATPase, and Fis domain